MIMRLEKVINGARTFINDTMRGGFGVGELESHYINKTVDTIRDNAGKYAVNGLLLLTMTAGAVGLTGCGEEKLTKSEWEAKYGTQTKTEQTAVAPWAKTGETQEQYNARIIAEAKRQENIDKIPGLEKTVNEMKPKVDNLPQTVTDAVKKGFEDYEKKQEAKTSNFPPMVIYTVPSGGVTTQSGVTVYTVPSGCNPAPGCNVVVVGKGCPQEVNYRATTLDQVKRAWRYSLDKDLAQRMSNWYPFGFQNAYPFAQGSFFNGYNSSSWNGGVWMRDREARFSNALHYDGETERGVVYFEEGDKTHPAWASRTVAKQFLMDYFAAHPYEPLSGVTVHKEGPCKIHAPHVCR